MKLRLMLVPAAALICSAASAAAGDTAEPERERFLTCYEAVAKQENWRSQGATRLSRNETFAMAVAEACRLELQPFRPILEERLLSALAAAGKEPDPQIPADAKLLESGMRFVTVRAILADWPEIEPKVFGEQFKAAPPPR